MKKKLQWRHRSKYYAWKTKIYSMTTLLCIVLSIMQVGASGSLQENKVSVSLHQTTLKEVLDEIERQAGVKFLYLNEEIDVSKKVEIILTEISPKEVLDTIFRSSDITYIEKGDQIVLKRRPPIKYIEHRSLAPVDQKRAETMAMLAARAYHQLSISADAMDITVQGTVTAHEDGSPLPGVNVVLKGTTIGAVTDVNGTYALSVPDENAVLVFSSIGYLTEEVEVGNRSQVDISLVADIQTLLEVVVVGYGTTQKKDVTSAVTTINSRDFLPGSFNSPLQTIEGKIPGVTISNPAAADPNRSTDVQIRGASSFRAGNGPLIVIDGLPGGDLRNVAQQDIESITVLRDAASSAIYGSRGANGVILVTTKRGSEGRVTVNYESYFDHDQVATKPNILSPEEFVERERGQDFGARTNWYNELIREDNFGQNHVLAVGGGNESSVFRLSANYRTKSGIDIATDREEYGLRASFQQKAMEGILEFGGNFSHRVAREEYTNYGAFRQAVQLNPTEPIMDPDNPLFYNTIRGSDFYNPVQDLLARENGADKEYSTIDLSARFNILKNLSTEIKVARQSQDEVRREYYTSKAAESVIQERTGRARLENEKWQDWMFDWTANYALKLERHDLKLLAGYSYQEFNNKAFWSENADFISDAFGYNNLGAGNWMNEEGRLGMDSWRSKEKTIGFFGRLNYSFDDTYLLTASVRYEGNTKFGTNNKWGLFPAVSAAWRINKLAAFDNVGFVNDLKLRVSYGETGRSGFARYTSLAKYSPYGRYQNDEGEWIRVYGPGNNYNPNLSWEKAISYNVGIDFTLLEHKLSGSVDFFVRKSSDLINNYYVPVPPYLHERMEVNVGTASSRGVELSLSYDVIDQSTFKYTTSLTGSYAKSRMDKFSKGIFNSDFQDLGALPAPGNPGNAYRLKEGVEIGSFYGYKYAGVDEDGNMLIWKDGIEGSEKLVALTESDENRDKTYIGHGMPRYELSWTNTLTYKSLDLTLFFRGRFDYQILNQYQMYYGLQSQAGVNLLEDAFTRNNHIQSSKVISDYFLEDGDYFKLENVTLGWTPNVSGIKYLKKLRIFGTVRNVFTITDFSGLDPTVVGVTGLEPGMGGLDVYPITRNYSLGVQVTF